MSLARPPDIIATLAAPAPGRARLGPVLAGHIVFTLLNSLLLANTGWLMPMLVRLKFGAGDPWVMDWQTTLVTAAVPTFMMLSVFWNELLRRVKLRTYLLLFWLVALCPFGCVGFVQSYWQLAVCQIVANAGLAGGTPLTGKLLKHFYPDAVRGRVFALLSAVSLLSGIGGVSLLGTWLHADPEAFRYYLPLAALLQVAALAILWLLARRTGAPDEPLAAVTPSWAALLRPVLHMRRALRADRTFLRYEGAFMTYGAAFMLCEALLPVLATDRLHLRYEQYADATQVPFRLAMLLLTLPMGWLNDRAGPVRICGLAFGTLALYPLLLVATCWGGSSGASWGLTGLTIANVVFGLGLSGVQLGWTLGPVTLAGSPEKAPHYAAIHATLVGVRGVFFQGLGMLLYKLTGRLEVPLLLAAGAFTWGAVQMWRLHVAMRWQGAAVCESSLRDG